MKFPIRKTHYKTISLVHELTCVNNTLCRIPQIQSFPLLSALGSIDALQIAHNVLGRLRQCQHQSSLDKVQSLTCLNGIEREVPQLTRQS